MSTQMFYIEKTLSKARARMQSVFAIYSAARRQKFKQNMSDNLQGDVCHDSPSCLLMMSYQELFAVEISRNSCARVPKLCREVVATMQSSSR